MQKSANNNLANPSLLQYGDDLKENLKLYLKQLLCTTANY